MTSSVSKYYVWGLAAVLLAGTVYIVAQDWNFASNNRTPIERENAQRTLVPNDKLAATPILTATANDETEIRLAEPAVTGSDISATEPELTPDTEIDSASTALDEHLAVLNAQLLDERQARLHLEEELSTVKSQLASLQQRLERLAPEQRFSRRDQPRQPVSPKSFFEAGFDSGTANYLAERWSEQEMNLLYLRDQAIREGWIDTEQYRQAARDLRQDSTQLREELSEEDYARYLYALGMPNLVQIDNVINNSPAQSAGLQPGDRIIRYDGQRIYNYRDLRNISTAGDPDAPVPVLIDRDGVLIEAVMPRGPLGVMLSPLSELTAG